MTQEDNKAPESSLYRFRPDYFRMVATLRVNLPKEKLGIKKGEKRTNSSVLRYLIENNQEAMQYVGHLMPAAEGTSDDE